jgi:iron complex outermembrane receptor protein
LNARLSLSELEVARGNLSVALWGTNLTDEEYRVHGTDFGDYIAYSWGDPRTYGVDVSWQY